MLSDDIYHQDLGSPQLYLNKGTYMSFQKAPLLELRFTEPVSHLCSEKRQHLVHIAKRLAMLTLRSLIFIMTLARQSPGAVSEDVLGAVSAGAVTWILTGNDLSVFQGEP